MEPDNIESLCLQAKQAMVQGQMEQARQYYTQALALSADAPDVHYGLATVYFLLNDLDSATHHFKEVIRLDPVRPGAHINLGAVLNRKGDLDAAIVALRRGIQLDPHRAEGYYNLGLVYKNKGEPNLAVQAYVEATRINPRMVDAHYNLANVYLEMERYRQATAHYRQVLQMRPNFEKAQNGLAQAEAAQAGGALPEEARQPDAPTVDLKKTIDPTLHGAVLTNLHKATIESETHGRQFMTILEKEIEPAIKDLSTCLLTPDTAGMGLNQCIQRFEAAIQNMRSAQRHFQTTIERVRAVGDRLLKP